MTITTKANVGDTVYFIDCNKATEGVVLKIDISIIDDGKTFIEYSALITHKDGSTFTKHIKEQYVFASKQDLANYILGDDLD